MMINRVTYKPDIDIGSNQHDVIPIFDLFILYHLKIKINNLSSKHNILQIQFICQNITLTF